VTLCLAELKLDGFPGLRDGLSVLKGMVETYWNDVYPKLDPDDNNDPTERINILNNLSAPVGTFGDPYRFLERLRETPLCSSPRMGRVTLSDILDSEDKNKPAPEAPTEGQAAKPKRPGATQITAAFRDSDPAAVTATHAAVGQIIETVAAINAFLTGTVGAVNGASFADLTKSLKKIQASLAANIPGAAGAAAVASAGQVEEVSSGGGGSVGDGKIRSREDVVFLLGQICDFYARSEPSSPVPMLLKRAQRLAKMSFMEIMNDLTPEALNQLRVIAGSSGEAAQPPPE
jgi:type VI secretion system protein ImpA